ncbi:hypothetical protein KPH14_007747 [Odynerus spinipes]|uniref:BHLH domain-containing protein n=1 Tax=Odynerus spinipes TaxID=1348599 RepID=A0AAD9RK49_9HYME|nr:hypothetical protein KPH14_007747 [Odynerus spinipes]
MPRKENTKAKTWERDRRKRMNAYFKTLADLLPPHQEGRKRNKVDILIHASKYIKDLHVRTEELFFAHASEAHKEELARLKKLVTLLFSRTQLLSTLLQEAGISVPAEPALERISPLKWSNKINVEDVEKYFTKEKSSEKKKERPAEIKVPLNKKSSSQSSSKKVLDETNISTNSSIENQENHLNCVNNKDNESSGLGNDSQIESRENNVQIEKGEISKRIAKNRQTIKNGNVIRKMENQKKVKKKKSKLKNAKKPSTMCISNSVTNLTPSTLILSGGKLVPLVTPMTSLTSNIIVNTQPQSANPIILSNAQQSQMIVMQPLTNHVQNSVVSIRNQAVINTMQKVTLNTMPSIRANMVVDSQNWASNVKNIINSTRIGGLKGILPKGKEVTKTTMTYKVPIPAIHKEKVDKSKESSNRKEFEAKSKVNKNHIKNTKNTLLAEEITTEKSTQCFGDNMSTEKVPYKRCLSIENVSSDEPEDKKRKGDDIDATAVSKVATSSIQNFTATCKSIESLKHVIEKIGENGDQFQEKSHTSMIKHGEMTESSIAHQNSSSPNDTSNNIENASDTPESIVHVNSDHLHNEEKSVQNKVTSPQVSPIHTSSEISATNDVMMTTSPTTEYDIPVDNEVEEIANTAESSNTKSTLSEVSETIQNAVQSERVKEVCNLGRRFDSLLRVNAKGPEMLEGTVNLESNKIILNLDTNTTTSMKPETSTAIIQTSAITTSTSLNSVNIQNDDIKLARSSKEDVSKCLPYNTDNSFIPINNRTEALHSDLSNDIFASLQVPSNSHNTESISPTAAFLMAFPLVSSLNGKTEVLDEEMKEDFKYHSQTPPMLLQIGSMEPNSFKVRVSTSPMFETVTEKCLKSTCDNKKDVVTSASVNIHSEIMLPIACTPTTRAVPKVVSEETLKEPYKMIQSTLPPVLEKTTDLTNTFSHASSPYSNVNSSSVTSITTCTSKDCQKQTASIFQNNAESTATENIVSQSHITATPIVNKSIDRNPAIQTSDYNNVQYSDTQSFLPNYSTIANNNPRTLQQNASTFIDASTTEEPGAIGSSRNIMGDMSQMSLASCLNNITTTTTSSSTSLGSLQTEYTSQIKGKESQERQHVTYVTQNKESLIDTTMVPNHRLDYAAEVHQSLPTSSQNLQQSYSTQMKDQSLPILASQGNENEHSPHNQSYTKLSKDSNEEGNNGIEQSTKLNTVLGSKQQEHSDERRDPNYVSTKKIDIDPFGQTFSYGAKSSISTQPDQADVNPNVVTMFQEKHNTPTYTSFSNKDVKKVTTNTTNSMTSKSLIQDTPALLYTQQQIPSFVATSNYEQSTVTDNHTKSMTTVAHNSSNFSILSWTTFSPVGGCGNNNPVQFEQGPHQNDNAEGKTICENYNYVPLHKENSGFSDVLTTDAYSTHPNVSGIDKLRMKSDVDTQKQPFIDASKNRNVQSTVSSTTKQNRMQNQPQSSSNNDYKFSTENKSKSKYEINPDYIQAEYPNISEQTQQSSQQHGQKNHQSLSTKHDKSSYPISSYDSHINFDVPEISTQLKYSIETYVGANFKYVDKIQQHGQHRYQLLNQAQVPPLQQGSTTYNSDVNKHRQQQQSSNKLKSNQQQHTIRAPVNWMMTPEFKHNTSITDIIFPPIAHSFPNLSMLPSEQKRPAETFYSDEQPFPWSPTKNSVHNVEQNLGQQSIKAIDQHIVSSTLSTLVGDLDLGTNVSEKQNFLLGQMPPRILIEQNKELIRDKEENVLGRDFHTVLSTQNVPHSAQGSSFLSVSQLVEQEKAEKSQQQHYHLHHHHPHQHQHNQQQQQQQQQQQTNRKHQRKNNVSPRGSNSKRQIDIRKQTPTNDHLHQRQEEQKTSTHTFSEQVYQQQQKYQQNSTHWRNRNCKSNYTAEALISSNTNINDANHPNKHTSIKITSGHSQNKFQSSLPTTDTVMPLNYFSNTDDNTGYGQMVNQNFNSYAYTSNTNIYPTSTFITSIPNTSSGYMMPLHENTDYMEVNSFLLPNTAISTAPTSTTSTINVSTSVTPQKHQNYGKHQNCDKRSYASTAKKGKRKGADGSIQNLEFPLTNMNSPLDDYHQSNSFLPPPPHANSLYQNHPQTNMYTKAVNGLPPPPPPVAGNQNVPTITPTSFPVNPNIPRVRVTSNSVTMPHHPSGTSLTNFNLSTIFPEMNDKITGYKPTSGVPPGPSQLSNHGSISYAQRINYTNSLCQLPQISETMQFNNDVTSVASRSPSAAPAPPPPPPPPLPPSGVIHYKNV